jgi:hypothetical protein
MIGLLDIDSKMPNLALMKLKSYYGDEAKMISPIEAWSYETVYASKLFNYSVLPSLPQRADIGGTGYNIKAKLPEFVEKCQPDYSIYPRGTVSMQRYSTGCIRHCPFCVVSEKEGNPVTPSEPLNLNPNGKWIYLLDNNFFASPNWLESIKHLIASNQPVSFEGVDIRILNEEHINWLSKVKLRGRSKHCISIAWDNPKDDVLPNIKNLIKVIKPAKVKCYVLIGFWSSPDEDLYRVERLRELDIDPFVMPFNKEDKYQRRFARWVNRRAIFDKVKWENYK